MNEKPNDHEPIEYGGEIIGYAVGRGEIQMPIAPVQYAPGVTVEGDAAEIKAQAAEILRVATRCEFCRRRDGIKTNSAGRWICARCIRVGTVTRSIRRMFARVGRNEKCPCGSGLKYKHCCKG